MDLETGGFDAALRTFAAERLASFERTAEPLGDRRAAAVALTLVADDERRPCFVLTRRAAKRNRHAEQWALPGGRVDPGESVIDAALRDPREVAAIHRIQLAALMRTEVPRLRQIPQSDRPVISIPLHVADVHAPTAAIVHQLREVVVRGVATRVAHYEQTVFAWT